MTKLIRTINYRALAFVGLAGLSACMRPAAAQLEQAPDFWNTVDRFDVKKVYSYDDLQANAQIATPTIPWSDTYWPLASKSLAWRYADTSDQMAGEKVGIASFLRRFATEAAKPAPDPLLSPAEKYDIVYALRHNQKIVPADITTVATGLLTLDAQIATKTADADKKAVVQQMRTQLLKANFATSLSMSVSGWTTFMDEGSKKDNKFLGDDSATGNDWSWEGHCHGWSPAAVMSLPPKHGVQVALGGKNVFFSEGDIRGLMTKAWADSAPDDKQYFLGKRCEQSPDDPNAPIAAGPDGEGYIGTLKIHGIDVPFTVTKNLPRLLHVTVGSRAAVMNVYQIHLNGFVAHADEILLEEPATSQFWTADSLGDIELAMHDHVIGDHVHAADATLTGCWDPNPASFHQVLIAQLAERKLGFVMDRTRTAQVWNQPIYSANFNIGDLQPVSGTDDVAARYRASGTAYLAEVTTVVQWSGEPGTPQTAYADGFDAGQLQSSTYNYTLEFDSAKRLIGGEWGSLSTLDPTAESPDFLFGFKAGATPVDAVTPPPGKAAIDYSGIIGKLHDCSLSPTTDGKLQVGPDLLPYSNCTITALPQ